jgi:hypothetical protein
VSGFELGPFLSNGRQALPESSRPRCNDRLRTGSFSTAQPLRLPSWLLLRPATEVGDSLASTRCSFRRPELPGGLLGRGTITRRSPNSLTTNAATPLPSTPPERIRYPTPRPGAEHARTLVGRSTRNTWCPRIGIENVPDALRR